MPEHPLITLFLTHAACAAFGAYIVHRWAKGAIAKVYADALTAAQRQFQLGIRVGEQRSASVRRVAHARR